MLRRTFLTIASSASPLLWLLSKLKPWPFVEIDVVYLPGFREAIDGDDFLDNARLTTCDLCCETFVEDMDDDRKPRKFYRTTDGSGLIVCERCTSEYLNT